VIVIVILFVDEAGIIYAESRITAVTDVFPRTLGSVPRARWRCLLFGIPLVPFSVALITALMMAANEINKPITGNINLHMLFLFHASGE
jgi:hypothetical protein